MTQLAADAVPDTTAAEPGTRTPREGPGWVRLFLGGVVLWMAAGRVSSRPAPICATGGLEFFPTGQRQWVSRGAWA